MLKIKQLSFIMYSIAAATKFYSLFYNNLGRVVFVSYLHNLHSNHTNDILTTTSIPREKLSASSVFSILLKPVVYSQSSSFSICHNNLT